MQPIQTDTIETILHHHTEAFVNNDIGEIMKDYTEQSEIWTPNGAVVGLEAIASFYTYVFALLPKESTKLELKQKLIKDEKAYIAWSAESPVVHIPAGSESFEIKDGKIRWQSTSAHIIHK